MNTSFFQQVYRVVAMIPRGRVATFGQIATYLGNPRAARTVGWALHSTPAKMDLPWHRVINAQGRIGGPQDGYRAREQRALLEAEGVVLDKSGRIDLEEFGWQIP